MSEKTAPVLAFWGRCEWVSCITSVTSMPSPSCTFQTAPVRPEFRGFLPSSRGRISGERTPVRGQTCGCAVRFRRSAGCERISRSASHPVSCRVMRMGPSSIGVFLASVAMVASACGGDTETIDGPDSSGSGGTSTGGAATDGASADSASTGGSVAWSCAAGCCEGSGPDNYYCGCCQCTSGGPSGGSCEGWSSCETFTSSGVTYCSCSAEHHPGATSVPSCPPP